jgi:Kyakuja-Dileera-Zisupton transposase
MHSTLIFHQGSRKVVIEHLVDDVIVTAAIVRYGLMPCAPYNPTTAITIRALELYRVTHLRCPQVSIHSFVKSLCDLHCRPFKAYISRQFSIAFDLYLSIRMEANKMVHIALKRDSPDWKLRNVCPSCSYVLEGEPKLKFSMLYAVDGGNSLKRIQRREAAPDAANTGGSTVGKSSESIDTRVVEPGMYMTNVEVDKWSEETLKARFPKYSENIDDGNPCAERWRNMKSELTALMWGVFAETGIFLALCRHGFVLLLVDMIRSGEL